MIAVQSLLDQYRATDATTRQADTYFEEMAVCYYKNER